MIIGNKLNMLSYRKDNIITTSIENRLNMHQPYEGVRNFLVSKVHNGYKLYNINDHVGFSDLLTVSTGKYLCFYDAIASSSTNYTILDTYITRHEDVIITGIQLDTDNQIINHSLKSYTSMRLGDFNNKLSFQYMDLENTHSLTSEIKNVKFKNCKVSHFGQYSFPAPLSSNSIYKNITLNNVDTDALLYAEYDSTTLTNPITNIIFRDENVGIIDTTTKPNVINIQNITGINGLYFINGRFATTDSVMNVRNMQIIDSDLSIGDIHSVATIYSNNSKITQNFDQVSAIIKPVKLKEDSFVSGVKTINWDLVDFDDFEDVGANFNTEYVIDNKKFYNLGTKTNYVMTFQPNLTVPDKIKKFSDDRYFFVRRKDIEKDVASSSGKKTILNYDFYDTSSGGSVFDYEHDENFLIKAYRVSDTSQVAEFCYYNNTIYPTVYNEIWDNNEYNIENVFQIWEIESLNSLGEIIRDKTTNQGFKDGPLTGSIKFNNLDNEILDQI